MTTQVNRPLRALAEVALGRQRSPQNATGPHMVKYLRAANVKDGTLDLTDVKEMNFDPQEQLIFRLLPGDVLISEGSGSLSAVGASAVWNGELDGVVCFQNTLLRARPRAGTDPRFLAWWCRHAFGSSLFASIATGANIFHLGAQRVRMLPAWLPGLSVQRSVADFLDRETARIDRLLERREALAMRALERMRARTSIALSGSTWPTVRLRRLLSRPLQYGANEAAVSEERDWPRYIRTSDVTTEGELRPDTFKSLSPEVARPYLLKDQDLLFTRSGATVGKTILYRSDWGPACFAGYMIRARFNTNLVLPKFVAHFAHSDQYRQQLGIHSLQATIQNVSAERYGEFEMRLPAIDDQRRVIAELDDETRRTRQLITKLSAQGELFRERRRALVTAAVTGKIEIPT